MDNIWKITLSDGSTVRESDVSPAHYQMVGELAGTDRWADLDPSLTVTAAVAWIAVLEAANDKDNRNIQDQLQRAMKIPMREFWNRIQRVPLDSEE